MVIENELYIQHRHTGIDGQKVDFTDIDITKQSAITAPSGGATIDAEARTAINSIITALENLGLVEPN